jgi:hypothetical protein
MNDAGLGPLRDLPGTWIGDGFSLVTRAGPEDHPPRAPQVTVTHEAIAFAEIGPLATRQPQEGPGGLLGLYYAHQASDAASRTPLFIEPGIWLTMAGRPDASAETSVVRLATLPDGHTVVACGSCATVHEAPQIPAASPAPIDLATGRSLPLEGNLAPDAAEKSAELIPGAIEDPNTLLRSRTEGQRIASTTILTIAGGPGTEQQLGDIPFTVKNPDSLSLQATFWIERVADAAGPGGEVMQLQYSQTILISGDGIGWPSISVATLVKP